MFNALILAVASKFNGPNASLDKNGKEPVILNVLSGIFPNRNVLSGTIAENMQLQVGKSYLFQVREVEADPTYGRRFTYTKVAEVSALEIAEYCHKYGPADMFEIEPIEVASTTRASIKEGSEA